jgi:hypothetical protein
MSLGQNGSKIDDRPRYRRDGKSRGLDNVPVHQVVTPVHDDVREVMGRSRMNGDGSKTPSQLRKPMDLSSRFMRYHRVRQNRHSRTHEVPHPIHVDDAVAKSSDGHPSAHPYSLAYLSLREATFKDLIVTYYATLQNR